MAHITEAQKAELTVKINHVADSIEASSITKMSFLADILPIYSTALVTKDLKGAFEEVNSLIMAVCENRKASTKTSLQKVNKAISDIAENGVWKDYFQHLSWGHVEDIATLVRNMAKARAKGQQVVYKDEKINASTALNKIKESLWTTLAECRDKLNAHNMASTPEGTEFVPMVDLFAEYANAVNFFDKEMDDKIRALKKAFKLDEDLAQMEKIFDGMLEKLMAKDRDKLMAKLMAIVSAEQTPANTVAEPAEATA
jgi:hypothetical protein